MSKNQKDSAVKSVPPPSYKPAVRSRGAKAEKKFRQAAEQCFSKLGYAGTKVSDIIEQSGCSTGSYYHRFKDKRALFDVMLFEYVDYVSAKIDSWDMRQSSCKDMRGLLTLIAKEFRQIVATSGGFLRAAQELSFTEPTLWKSLSDLSLYLWDALEVHLTDYAADLRNDDPAASVKGAVQTVLTLVLQASLGLGQLFPKSLDDVEALAVNAGLGVLNHGNC